MKPFIFLLFILFLLSCNNANKMEASVQNTEIKKKDSLLEYSRLRYVKFPNTDSSVYLFDITNNYIGIRGIHRNQITLKESFEKLKDILPKYFSINSDLSSFNIGFHDGIISQYDLTFNRKELENTFKIKNYTKSFLNNTLEELLLHSNLKQEINSIFKPYGYCINYFSSEKVVFDYKVLKNTTKSSNQDSVKLSESPFVGYLNIKMNKILKKIDK